MENLKIKWLVCSGFFILILGVISVLSEQFLNEDFEDFEHPFFKPTYEEVKFDSGAYHHNYKDEFQHPLDPLTPQEIDQTRTVIINECSLISWKFVWITLQEPLKSDLLPNFLGGFKSFKETIPRRAFALIVDKSTQEVFEVIVDLGKNEVESWTGVDPLSEEWGEGDLMSTVDDATSAAVAVFRDQRVHERLAKLGIDFRMIVPTPWSFGYKGDRPELQGKLLYQVFFFVKHSRNDNFFANPLGFAAIVDVIEKKVLFLEDHPIQGDSPDVTNREGEIVPPDAHNYDPELTNMTLRQGVNPVLLSQPQGNSFTLKGNLLNWQKFQMRIGFNGREGIVLHHLIYKDGEELRPLIYRASLSELYVPYGDPRIPLFRQRGFDIGGLGIGQGSGDLKSRKICAGGSEMVRYLDAYAHKSSGRPVLIKNAICVFEEPDGILWTKTNLLTGKSVTVQSQRLILRFLAIMGNYEYIFQWEFYQDASIRLEVQLTGILHVSFVAENSGTPSHGTIVAPNVNAPFHQHLIAVRLDMDVDGTRNSVSSVDIQEDPKGPLNPYGNGFSTHKTIAATAGEGRWKASMEKMRSWFVSSEKKSSGGAEGGPLGGKPRSEDSGSPGGYRLIGGSMPPLLLQRDSPLYPKCAFAEYNLWVTPYNEGQLYAAGFYLNNSGLPEWVGADEGANVLETDVVIWHVFGTTHIPRNEDFPVMPVEKVGFWLKPYNFFESSPALDIPSSS